MVSHLGKGGDDRATHSVSVVFVAAETNSCKLFSAAVWPPRNYQWARLFGEPHERDWRGLTTWPSDAL